MFDNPTLYMASAKATREALLSAPTFLIARFSRVINTKAYSLW